MRATMVLLCFVAVGYTQPALHLGDKVKVSEFRDSKVLQVVDDKNMIVTLSAAGRSWGDVWLRCESTKGVVDGAKMLPVWGWDQEVKITDTKRYITATGLRTVFLIDLTLLPTREQVVLQQQRAADEAKRLTKLRDDARKAKADAAAKLADAAFKERVNRQELDRIVAAKPKAEALLVILLEYKAAVGSLPSFEQLKGATRDGRRWALLSEMRDPWGQDMVWGEAAGKVWVAATNDGVEFKAVQR